MPQSLLLAYTAFVLLLFLGLLVLDARGLFKKHEGRHAKRKGYRPRVLVMMPCKGGDIGLYNNLRAASRQDYKNYRLVAILDRGDPALETVERAGVECVYSDSRCTKCSGKVRALATAMERFAGYDIYAVLDSDELVAKDWLSRLVAPFAGVHIGASVMFPLFKPIAGGFWSHTKQVWGFVGQSLMESGMARFVDGGSFAFRASLMDRKALSFFKNSRYSVSDDICINMIVSRSGLGIAYDRRHHPITYVDETLATFWEWANRQTALAIFAYRRMLYYGLAYYLSEVLVFATGVLGAALVSPLFALLLLHAAISFAKNESRIGRDSSPLATAAATVLLPFIYAANLAAASGTRSITWRGRRYRLH